MGDIQGDNLQEEDVERTLLSGCFFGDVNKVRRSINRNPWVNVNNVRTESEKTLLMVAYSKGHDNVVRLLMSEGGVDSTCRDWQGRAVLSIANQQESVSNPKLLESMTEYNCFINKQDADRLLEQACSIDDASQARILLTSCHVVNSAFVTIRESFQKACKLASVGIVAVMLARPGLITTDVLNDRRNDSQRSVAFTNDAVLLSVLMARQDLQLDVLDAQQQCPLHVACTTGRVDLVQHLLTRDMALLCIQDKIGGNTPMHYACMEGHLETVQLILEHPMMKTGYVKIKNNMGHSLVMVAVTKGHFHVFSLLLSYIQMHADDLHEFFHEDCKQSLALRVAASQGHVSLVQTLLQAVTWSDKEVDDARQTALVDNNNLVLSILDALPYQEDK